MDHSSRSHMRNSASSAHRWTVCEGCLNFCADLPEPPPGPWAIEGTRKHEELEFSLDIPGLRRPDEPEVDTLLEWIWAHKPKNLEPEMRVEFSETCGGTLDAAWQTDDFVFIFDAKFGYDPVEVVENVQLKIYAEGRYVPGLRTDIVLVIGQPNAFHADGPIRTWIYRASERPAFRAWLAERIAATFKPDAPLVPGKHCKYCPGEHVCPANEARALAVASEAFASVRDLDLTLLPAPQDLGLERLGRILAGEAALRRWLDACEEHAKFLAVQGHKIPGKKLVPTTARRKWAEGKTPLELAAELEKITGRNRQEFLAVVGITDAEKKCPKEYRDQMAFLMDKKPSGNMTLVDDADARDAVSPTQNAFQGVIVPTTIDHDEMPAPLWPGMQYAEVDPQSLIS